jgi:alanine racemase
MPQPGDTPHPPPETAHDLSGPWIEVDLGAVERNLERIHRWCGVPLMPVIKANAYGHGLVPVARRLAGAEGVEGLCVGCLREAVALRQAGIRLPVLNLGPFTAAEAQRIAALEIAQSVSSDAVDLLARAAAAQGRTAAVHVKIDTGLGRMGVPHDRAAAFITAVAQLDGVRIAGVFTALSEDPDFDRLQVRRFTAALAGPAERGIALGRRHAASSAAILEAPELALDMVRPGIMLFGHYPSAAEHQRRRIELEPALTLKARVSAVKRLRAGDPVGYHRAYRAPGDETLILGSIGYADGYPVQLAGRAEALVDGVRHPLVASVTANHICLRLSGGVVRPGDEIVLYGRQGEALIDLQELAPLAERSVYNLLARLNPELPRLYQG